MSTNFGHMVPPESYSRELDERVMAMERPYGYLNDQEAAESGNYDQAAKESRKGSR